MNVTLNHFDVMCIHSLSFALLGGLALPLFLSLFFGNAGAQSGTGTSFSRVRRAHVAGRVRTYNVERS